MALTSFGYDGTMVENAWAGVANNAGVRYSVGGQHDFEVTPRTGATLTSNVAAGDAYGCGVKVTNDAQITIAHTAAPASGTRWDAIVLRRDWTGTGGISSVQLLTGTATYAIPGGRFAGPGVKDDQVLALVPISSSSSIPGTPVDCRWKPSTVITVPDLVAITDPVIGMEAVVLGVGTAPDSRWRYQLDATSNPAWARDETEASAYPSTVLTGFLTTATGWTVSSLIREAGKVGNVVGMYVEIRTSADVPVDANGGVTDTYIATIDASLAPSRAVPFPLIYRSSTSTTWSGVGEIRTDGSVYIVSGSSNVPIAAQAAGTWSLKFNVTYFVPA